MAKILLAEDEQNIASFIRRGLQEFGHEVQVVHDGGTAWSMLQEGVFDLLVLDVIMPKMDGLEVCRQFRLKEGYHTPVIILTALGTTEDIVKGLDAGADDYITKPFSLAILRARVNAQLRRRVKSSCVELDGFRFDFERMAFWKNGEPIELSKTEQKLLRLLVENRGQTVSRGVLVDRIWTDGADFVDENALSVTVKRLRVKLEDDPSSPQYLKTVYGLGYTWAVK